MREAFQIDTIGQAISVLAASCDIKGCTVDICVLAFVFDLA
jgi:hypothetical protein